VTGGFHKRKGAVKQGTKRVFYTETERGTKNGSEDTGQPVKRSPHFGKQDWQRKKGAISEKGFRLGSEA